MQPATLMFKVAGVDVERGIFPGGFEDHFMIPAKEIPVLKDCDHCQETSYDIQALGEKELPKPTQAMYWHRTTLPGIVTCNMTNCIGIDGTKAEDLTKATYICRKQMDAIVAFLQNYVPGFENCYLISSASLIGIRETRHFEGEARITEQDISEARVFDDWVVTKAKFNFDVYII